MKETVVPNRNAIFSSIAFAYALSIAQKAGADQVDIALGVHSGDHTIYPDCRPEFYSAIHKAFQLGNWDSETVSLYLPYLDFDKTKILRDAEKSIEQLGLDFDIIFSNTITSYSPTADGQSSGLTGSDVERILAFHEIGKVDPIDYVEDWDIVVARALKFESEFQSEPSQDV